MIIKLKKFIIFLVCVILVVSLFTFSVSGLSVNLTYTIGVNNASVYLISNDPVFTESGSLQPVDILRSPSGGNFYGYSWNGTKSYDVSYMLQTMYFNSYNIRKGYPYRIKLNVVLPFAAAAWREPGEYDLAYRLFFRAWDLQIRDSDQNIRLTRFYNDDDVSWWDQLDPVNSPYGFYVDYAQSSISGNSAQFFFIPYEFTFVSTANYYLDNLQFNFFFRSPDPEFDYTLNSGGYYGISDFTIEQLDPSNVGAMILNSVDTIKDTTTIISNNLANLPSRIQSILRSELNYLLNEQRKIYQQYKDSFDEAFNDPKYDEVDDAKVNREHQLNSQIEDLTESGRDVAVETIDSAGEILSNSVTDPSDQSGSSIENGLFVWTRILDTVLQRVPWFGTMVRFSLSLGLFSFLMGIITYAVGKTSGKSAKNNPKNNKPKPPTPALKKGK